MVDVKFSIKVCQMGMRRFLPLTRRVLFLGGSQHSPASKQSESRYPIGNMVCNKQCKKSVLRQISLWPPNNQFTVPGAKFTEGILWTLNFKL
jgi:hypothetical protein